MCSRLWERFKAGRMDESELIELEEEACPTCGSCAGMFTANSMNCLTESLGMGLPGNGTIPAVLAKRLRLAKLAGMGCAGIAGKGYQRSQVHDSAGVRERAGRGHGPGPVRPIPSSTLRLSPTRPALKSISGISTRSVNGLPGCAT